MNYLLLIPVALLCLGGSYLSYSQGCRSQWWYVPLGAIVGLVISIIWYSTLCKMENAKQLYFFGMVWDCLAVAAYCFIPLFFFGVKLNWCEVAGLVCMLVGLALMKAGG